MCYQELVEKYDCNILCHVEDFNKLLNITNCTCESDFCSVISFSTKTYEQMKKVLFILDNL